MSCVRVSPSSQRCALNRTRAKMNISSSLNDLSVAPPAGLFVKVRPYFLTDSASYCLIGLRRRFPIPYIFSPASGPLFQRESLDPAASASRTSCQFVLSCCSALDLKRSHVPLEGSMSVAPALLCPHSSAFFSRCGTLAQRARLIPRSRFHAQPSRLDSTSAFPGCLLQLSGDTQRIFQERIVNKRGIKVKNCLANASDCKYDSQFSHRSAAAALRG
jgi:hypothetical protein